MLDFSFHTAVGSQPSVESAKKYTVLNLLHFTFHLSPFTGFNEMLAMKNMKFYNKNLHEIRRRAEKT